VLGAQDRVVELQREGEAQPLARQPDDLHVARLVDDRMAYDQRRARHRLLHDTRLPQQGDEGRGAPVGRLRHLTAGQLQPRVVDAQPGERGEHVLDGVHLGAAAA